MPGRGEVAIPNAMNKNGSYPAGGNILVALQQELFLSVECLRG